MRTGILEAMAAVLLLIAPATGRGADASFAYHGLLRDEKGAVLDERNHSIRFRLYDQPAGGSNLWSCVRNVYLNEEGLFSVELSGNAASGESLGKIFSDYASRTLYIGLTVDDDTGEIAPRQKLLSVPKAIWAADTVAAQGDIEISSNLVCSAAANTGDTSVNALTVTNALTCNGTLMTGSLTVNGNVDVSNSGALAGKGAIPIGGIVVWSGPTIPDGWAICDGNNGTPNLSSRFIVGAGRQYEVGATGGVDRVTLAIEQLPRHRHDIKFYGADSEGGWDKENIFFSVSAKYEEFENRGETVPYGGDSNGNTEPHENRPPYYAVYYIMRVK